MTKSGIALDQAFAKLDAYFHQDVDDHEQALREWFQSLTQPQQNAVNRVFDPTASSRSLSSHWRQAETGWRFSEKKLKLMFRNLLDSEQD